MGEDTKIEWAHHTFNPWWGCTKVSKGCENCYAESFAKRVGQDVWGPGATRRMMSDANWAKPMKWNRAAEKLGEPVRVFCASMCDVFEDQTELSEPRARLFRLIEATPALTWMLLTKRPENMTVMAPSEWAGGWPSNVWAMTSVEDQEQADKRIPLLARVPATVRGLSMEPLLGDVVFDYCDECGGHGLGRHGSGEAERDGSERECGPSRQFPPIHWVIAGGESGGGARPMAPSWPAGIQLSCAAAGVPFLFKQWGAFDEHGVRRGKKNTGRLLDGHTWDGFPQGR